MKRHFHSNVYDYGHALFGTICVKSFSKEYRDPTAMNKKNAQRKNNILNRA